MQVGLDLEPVRRLDDVVDGEPARFGDPAVDDQVQHVVRAGQVRDRNLGRERAAARQRERDPGDRQIAARRSFPRRGRSWSSAVSGEAPPSRGRTMPQTLIVSVWRYSSRSVSMISQYCSERLVRRAVGTVVLTVEVAHRTPERDDDRAPIQRSNRQETNGRLSAVALALSRRQIRRRGELGDALVVGRFKVVPIRQLHGRARDGGHRAQVVDPNHGSRVRGDRVCGEVADLEDQLRCSGAPWDFDDVGAGIEPHRDRQDGRLTDRVEDGRVEAGDPVEAARVDEALTGGAKPPVRAGQPLGGGQRGVKVRERVDPGREGVGSVAAADGLDEQRRFLVGTDSRQRAGEGRGAAPVDLARARSRR